LAGFKELALVHSAARARVRGRAGGTMESLLTPDRIVLILLEASNYHRRSTRVPLPVCRLIAAMLAPYLSGLLASQSDLGHPVVSWRHDRFGIFPKICVVARLAAAIAALWLASTLACGLT
jgi:hypothetical protein